MGCIVVTDEPRNVGDPFGSVVMSIKSMEGLPARAEIDVHCCRAMRRQSDFESSIRRRDRRRIIRKWALHRQDGIFGSDRTIPIGETIPAGKTWDHSKIVYIFPVIIADELHLHLIPL